MSDKPFHIAMYPWFAMGHLTPFLHISNKLAERGHKISFFLPNKTQARLKPFNLHKDLISFIPIIVSHVEGLPPGTETTADVPFNLYSLLMAAMDLTKPTLEAPLCELNPQFIFYNFTNWLPALARRQGIKSIFYSVGSPPAMGYFLSPKRKVEDLMIAPPGFPHSVIKLRSHESQQLTSAGIKDFGRNISLRERIMISMGESDGISFRACREMEGAYCNYVEEQFEKPVLLAGPVVPNQQASTLDAKWEKWLDSFEAKFVIFTLGSEWILEKDQFQELVLCLELTGIPFLAALKPPMGVETIESALPEGFEERVRGKGVVHGGWIRQQLILRHPSVGCFVTHCGAGSLFEGLVSECQLVFLPHFEDQFINARLTAEDLKVGVEIEKGEEDGLFTRAGVSETVKAVMDDDSNLGKEVRANHTKWREFLLGKELENYYIYSFVEKLHSCSNNFGLYSSVKCICFPL